MTKKLLAGLATGLLMVGTAATAGAASTTHTYDPSPDPFLGKDGVYSSIQHDITGSGFDVGVDVITSAILRIYTYDDNDTPAESYKFSLDGGAYGSAIQVVDSNINAYAYTFTSGNLSDYLQPDGMLNVALSGQAGDFNFDRSELEVTWTDAAPTPIPGSVLLLGSGLAGMVGLGRRRRLG